MPFVFPHYVTFFAIFESQRKISQVLNFIRQWKTFYKKRIKKTWIKISLTINGNVSALWKHMSSRVCCWSRDVFTSDHAFQALQHTPTVWCSACYTSTDTRVHIDDKNHGSTFLECESHGVFPQILETGILITV